jgi:SpoVK/Ycf46/Vps4 family AAA+-type ATPase
MKQLPKNIVFLSPLVQIPAELQKEVAVLDVPLPSREEIHSLIQKALQVLKTPPQFDLDSMIDAAMGLTYDEIENVIAKSIVSLGTLDKKLIRDEKKQIVKKSGLLEFLEPAKDSSKVGGLDLLKQWLTNRKLGFSAKAREIGLPLPKGMLLVGVPGCGKSLTATTVAREWQLPLLRLDLGKVFSGLVGSSESNIRNCIATCEAIAPCILWIDEIEKGLSGSSSSGQTDGGTTSRVFGSLLTWMQEKVSPVFVIATANDISSLPPELLRKGRFDEIFFVDLPTFDERKDIFDIHLERLGWTVEGMDKDVLSQSTEGFSGAEIEQVIISARYEALNTDESLNQKYLLKAISETVPLSKTMNDKLVTLRTWAKHRARQASSTKSDAPSDQFKVRANQLEYICN